MATQPQSIAADMDEKTNTMEDLNCCICHLWLTHNKIKIKCKTPKCTKWCHPECASLYTPNYETCIDLSQHCNIFTNALWYSSILSGKFLGSGDPCVFCEENKYVNAMAFKAFEFNGIVYNKDDFLCIKTNYTDCNLLDYCKIDGIISVNGEKPYIPITYCWTARNVCFFYLFCLNFKLVFQLFVLYS